MTTRILLLSMLIALFGCASRKQKTPEPAQPQIPQPQLPLDRTDTFVGNLNYKDYSEWIQVLDTNIVDTVILHLHNDSLDYGNTFRHTFSFFVNGEQHTHSTAITGTLPVDTTGYPHSTIGKVGTPFLLRNDSLYVNVGYHCCHSVGYSEFIGRPIH